MLLPIENHMVINADRIFAAMYPEETAWDYRDSWSLIGFAYDYDLIESVVSCKIDEDDDPIAFFDHLSTKEAAALIEDYVERYDLIGDYNAWRKEWDND